MTGVLYLHRIDEPKFLPTTQEVHLTLRTLCGKDAMRRAIFCTTFWDQPKPEESERRHSQLCSTPVLKEMNLKGARIARHSAAWVEEYERIAGPDGEGVMSPPWWDELAACVEGERAPERTEGWNHPITGMSSHCEDILSY